MVKSWMRSACAVSVREACCARALAQWTPRYLPWLAVGNAAVGTVGTSATGGYVGASYC